MDSTGKMGHTSNDLTTFLDHYGCRLPTTVKLVDGFRGTSEADTLDVGQIFVLHKVERQQTIIALDWLGQEICLQQNSQTKVHLLPLECQEYCTVKELVTAKSSYVLVLEDIKYSSLQIASGSKLILPNNRRSSTYILKCEVVDRDNSKEILLPLCLKGRFLPLVDITEYNIDDVLESQLPIKVRFVSQPTRANDPCSAHSLTSLGNIQLTHKSEVEMVFATSIRKESLMYLFPKTLNLTVGCGFKVSAETTKKIKDCRKALEKNDTNLKILGDLIKSSFYFTANPVRSFNLQSLKIAPVPHPRSLVTKQGKPPEDLSLNRETLTSYELVTSTSNNLCSVAPSHSFASGKYLERINCEGPERDEISEFLLEASAGSAASKLKSEVVPADSDIVMEVPPLPPKLGTLSKVEKRNNDFQSRRAKSPSPVPRKIVGAKAECGEKMNEDCTSPSLGGRPLDYNHKSKSSAVERAASSDDQVQETCPELPPKSISLKESHENKNDGNSGVSEPPLLPPKILLPPRKKSLGEDNLDDLPYLVVDVADWRKLEDIHRGYTVSSDKGCALEEDDTNESHENKNDGNNSGESEPPLLPTKILLPEREKSLDEDNVDLPYLVVDVTDWRKFEGIHRGYAVSRDDTDDSYIEVIYDPDETGRYEDTNGHNPEENGETDETDGYETPCDGIERPRSTEDQRDAQHGSKVDYKSYNEAVSGFHDPTEQRNYRCGELEEQKKREATKLFNTHYLKKCTKSERQESKERPLLVPGQQVDEESTDDYDQSYEEVESPREIFQRQFFIGKDTGQIIPGTKSLGRNQSSSTNNSRSSSSSSSTNSAEFSRQTSGENSRHTSLPRKTDNIWISARREDDCLDFKDIEHFFKLRKQLDAARAQVEDLKRQVAVKERDSTETTRTLLDSDGTSGSSGSSGSRKQGYQPKQFNMKISNSKHTNNSSLESTAKASTKQPKKKSNGFGGVFGKKMGKKSLKPPSLAEERHTSTPTVRKPTLSSDDDDYVECYERKYVNQETLVESQSPFYANASNEVQSKDHTSEKAIYYNAVGTEAALRYLQLGNPSEEDEKSI